MLNTIHEFWGTSIASFELGRFFKLKFKSFYMFDPATPRGTPAALPKPIVAQVAFGTPRTAFVENAKTNNGKVLLPMVNYHLTSSDRDQSNAYEPINGFLFDKSTYDPADGTRFCMPFPSRYNLNYNVSIWGNSYRELESMMHALIQSFTRGETHLKWQPNAATHPDVFLLTRLTWDGMWSDDTDLEGLDPKETRDVVKYTMTFIANTMIPKGVYKVPIVVPFTKTSPDGETPVRGFGGVWLEQVVNTALSSDRLEIGFSEP